MIDFSMEHPYFAHSSDPELEGIIPSGYFTDAELAAFSQLIDGRRSLPVYFGDCWRCYRCAYECSDFFDMVDHIIGVHDPEPVNEDESDEECWRLLESD
jgi:hypothetical protein